MYLMKSCTVLGRDFDASSKLFHNSNSDNPNLGYSRLYYRIDFLRFFTTSRANVYSLKETNQSIQFKFTALLTA